MVREADEAVGGAGPFIATSYESSTFLLYRRVSSRGAAGGAWRGSQEQEEVMAVLEQGVRVSRTMVHGYGTWHPHRRHSWGNHASNGPVASVRRGVRCCFQRRF